MVTLAALGRASHRYDGAIRHLPMRCGGVGQSANPQCRDPGRQSPATAALLVFSFGRHIVACAKAAATALRSSAKTSTTPFSTTCPAPSSIHRRQRQCWWRWAPRLRSSTRRAACGVSCWRISLSSPEQDMQRENNLEAARDPHRHPPAATAAERAHGAHQAGRKGFLRLAVGRRGCRARSRRATAAAKSAAIILGAAAPVPHRAKTAEALLVGRRIDRKIVAEAARAALDRRHAAQQKCLQAAAV